MDRRVDLDALNKMINGVPVQERAELLAMLAIAERLEWIRDAIRPSFGLFWGTLDDPPA